MTLQHGLARAARLVTGALLACGSEGADGSSGAPAALVGGWSSDTHQYVCVAEDGRLWLGDSVSELTGPTPCQVDDGSTFSCSSDEDGSGDFDGELRVAAGLLTLSITGCAGSDPGECEASYRRDTSLDCE
jgi:hypothetical protein